MKGLLTLAALVFGLGCLGTPRPATAQDIKDCTSGCTIVTCDRTWCTIWQCDASGCNILGTYANPIGSRQEQGRVQRRPAMDEKPNAFDQVCEAGSRKPCAFKLCSNGRCDAMLFNGTAFVPAGTAADLSELVERAHRNPGNSTER